VNVGTNRWSFKPEIGLSKAVGRWTFELTPGVTFYTDNGDFFGGKTREVSPLVAVQGGVTYSFAPGGWLALNAGYFVGGRTTGEDVLNDDEQEGVRFGATLALPVNRYHSVKLYASPATTLIANTISRPSASPGRCAGAAAIDSMALAVCRADAAHPTAAA
jgi:hypothetical protein